jgi:hypothetical protein
VGFPRVGPKVVHPTVEVVARWVIPRETRLRAVQCGIRRVLPLLQLMVLRVMRWAVLRLVHRAARRVVHRAARRVIHLVVLGAVHRAVEHSEHEAAPLLERSPARW